MESLPTVEQLSDAMQNVLRVASLPIREPSPCRPTFWSIPITYTKTRPVPANSGWLDYLPMSPGQGMFPSGYNAAINFVIATSLTNMATNGLQYRFLLEGDLLPAQYFNLSPGFDLNVERVGAPNPFPAQTRRVNIVVPNTNHLSLQVNNTSGAPVLAYAGLFGWFYPNLGSSEKEAFNASGFVQDDAVRGAYVR
jgi:hypothetical protein